ncbi:MAG: 50S ribosomal protein L15 [Thermodesulfobacteriota bacterium]
MLDRLKAPEGAIRDKKRVGRGEGSGLGKTSGRGHKGQRSRSGGKVKRGFEGGQMPLQRRLPKRGFTNIFRLHYNIINLGSLCAKFNSGDTVDVQALIDRGFVNNVMDGVKFLGGGDLKHPLTVKANKFSKTAIRKIVEAGGKVEVV